MVLANESSVDTLSIGSVKSILLVLNYKNNKSFRINSEHCKISNCQRACDHFRGPDNCQDFGKQASVYIAFRALVCCAKIFPAYSVTRPWCVQSGTRVRTQALKKISTVRAAATSTPTAVLGNITTDQGRCHHLNALGLANLRPQLSMS